MSVISSTRKVTSVVHTGKTVLNSRLPASAHEIAVKRSEPFPRISAAAFSRALDAPGSSPSASETIGAVAASFSGCTPPSPRIVVVGADSVGNDTESGLPLVVDARSDEEYDKVHFTPSLSFSTLKLRQDKMPYPLIATRHRPDRLVVVVDWDESGEAAELATKLVQTGWANVALLSGGLKNIAVVKPHLFEGVSAAACIAEAAIDAAAVDSLRPGSGAWLTVRRGSVRPTEAYKASLRSRNDRGSVISAAGSSVFVACSSSHSATNTGATSESYRDHGMRGLNPMRSALPGLRASVETANSHAGSRAPSISSLVSGSTIGGAPMRLLAGSATDARPGVSFSKSERF